MSSPTPTTARILASSIFLLFLVTFVAPFLTTVAVEHSSNAAARCNPRHRQQRHRDAAPSSPSPSPSPHTGSGRSIHRRHGRSATLLLVSSREDIYGAVHRKEYEMKRLNAQHAALSDPVRMAMGYAQEGVERKRLAAALRRVHDDPTNFAHPDYEASEREAKMLESGMAESGMRRGSFVVDIKRKSELSYPGEQFARYDDAGLVAEAMARLGADAVFVNVDYHAYGGDIGELKSAIRAVRAVNDHTAVVMKDIVVDELQLGLAKEAGADGVVLNAGVLGPALENFLDLATVIGLETIVECHTYNEVRAALDALAQNVLVSNRDRVTGDLAPDQAVKLAGLFPGSGGPIVTIAGGGVASPDQMKKLLAVGYDGVVVGKAVMGSARAPEFISVVRDRTLLPTEFSQWGMDDFEFDVDGNLMSGPKEDAPTPEDGFQ